MFYNVTRECADLFECVATNGVPPAVSKQIKIDVECKFITIDILAMLSLAPTCPTWYRNDTYLSQKASEKHKMVAQDDSKPCQILISD